MITRIRPFQTLFVLLALTGILSAQTLTVPNGALTVGDSIPISYSNPAMPGKKVTVTIDDGAFPTPNTVQIVIQLDASGNGSTQWIVPAWELATFNAPAVPEETRPIG